MMMQTSKVVNVASVRHHSPFRYPGGKTWFVPTFRDWIVSLSNSRPVTTLVEPFAGGAIVGLTAIAEGLVERLVLVERDQAVASVWHTIFGERCAWLIQRILEFQISRQAVQDELAVTPRSTHQLAFQTILRNRVQRGGIMAPGASLMLNGENGKGVASRWYPTTLATRIQSLHALRHRVQFIHGDGMTQIDKHAGDTDVVFFVDPPYTAGGKRAGSRLYACHELDHADLFRRVASVRGAALLTYDDVPQVRQFADQFGFAIHPILMKNTHHSVMTELALSKGFSDSNPQTPPADKLRMQPHQPVLFM